MDTKKTNLTPELKEIYDRVMNTSGGKAAAANTTPPLPTTALTPPPVVPATMPTAPSLGGLVPPPAMPISPTPTPTPNSGAMPAVPNLGTPMMPPISSPAEDALSSAPARPVSEGNTFSFSGTAHAPSPMPTVPGASPVAGAEKKKAKISLPVIIILGLVFIIVWGLFWAIIFGFIKR